MSTTKITWKFSRGKGWKKWVSADKRAWVTQWLVTPGTVHYGLEGACIGALRATPQEAMEMIKEVQDT